jgi:hypothetical protein
VAESLIAAQTTGLLVVGLVNCFLASLAILPALLHWWPLEAPPNHPASLAAATILKGGPDCRFAIRSDLSSAPANTQSGISAVS